MAQYEWEAHVVEYVDFVSSATSVHPNSKSGSVPPNLKSSIPFYGPQFTPPTFLQLEKRKHLPNVKPGTAYMKEITIVHPFYFDGLDQCPRCQSLDVKWGGWTSTGHRDIHGIQREEYALGVQLQCKACKENNKQRGDPKSGEDMYCFATTSHLFWEKWEFWKIPR
ncbi:hypothetical protein SERLADRAFT_444161 [Serpula lacrymans var. lacrymans S7.9]|uniref:CxC5 like cysteine cluster associated with KDZ domain-containing protein n=1 Tax=Serpula lacrymans var. lacrymans (strain S7.9) TaxID=578457 RepID=F8PEP4_SERL9|nr:uncharacterized protein SERLADRAFT_444161 [Serpula lacrymans var. lacrymans S7.9]EGO18397.1 hypothetical protein SERLADRAFT_444161 [Serpula lacrymans var. lacrymans S7.9]